TTMPNAGINHHLREVRRRLPTGAAVLDSSTGSSDCSSPGKLRSSRSEDAPRANAAALLERRCASLAASSAASKGNVITGKSKIWRSLQKQKRASPMVDSPASINRKTELGSLKYRSASDLCSSGI